MASLYVLVPGIVTWKIIVGSLTLTSLGLIPVSNLLCDQLLGFVLSLGSLIIVLSLESAGKLLDWHWHQVRQLPPLLLPIFCLSLVISLVEESVFRGYVFSTLAIEGSWWIAATASSFIFALLHLVWERKQTLPQVPGLFLMGMLLVVASTISNNSLYLAVGLHAGWILGLTCIDSAQLVTYKHQNHWMTGINQQPLAGFAGILCLAIAGFALFGLRSSKLLAVLN